MKILKSESKNPWPTLISSLDWAGTEDLNAAVFFACRKRLSENNFNSLSRENTNLYDDFVELSVVQKVEEMFFAGFKEAFKQYGKEMPQCSRENIADSWVNYETGGQGARIHNHPHAVFSAVYYVNAKPSEGVLHLYDPRWAGWDCPYVGEVDFVVPPRTGLMVIFPANVWHEIRPYHSSEPRVALVSNYEIDRSSGTTRAKPY